MEVPETRQVPRNGKVVEVERLETALGRASFASGSTQVKLQVLEQLLEFFRAASWGDEQLAHHAGRPALLRVLRELLLDGVSSVRAAALRAHRYLLLSDDVLNEAIALRTPHLVAGRLEATTGIWERTCALKLILQWLAVAADGSSELPVPRIFVLALVSVAEHQQDELQEASLRALCDAALVLPRLVADCHGVARLAEALVDPAQEALAPSLVATLLFVFDELSTDAEVQHLRAMCIRGLFAAYTGAASEPMPTSQEAKHKLAAQWVAARRGILLMLRSGTGLFALSSDPHGLPALCQLLRHSVDPSLKCALLDLFGDIVAELCIAPLPVRASARRSFAVPGSAVQARMSKGSRRRRLSSFASEPSVVTDAQEVQSPLTVPAAEAPQGTVDAQGLLPPPETGGATLAEAEPQEETRQSTASRLRTSGSGSGIQAALLYPSHPVDLLEVYAGLVLRTLLGCGLAEALGAMCLCEAAETTRPETVQRGGELLSELHRAAAVLLPASVCEELQRSMYPIIAAAASFSDMRRRCLAEEILTKLCEVGMNLACAVDTGLFGHGGPRRWLETEGMSACNCFSGKETPSSPRRARSARGRMMRAEADSSPIRSQAVTLTSPMRISGTSKAMIRDQATKEHYHAGFTDMLQFAQATGCEASHTRLLDDLRVLMRGPARFPATWSMVDDLHAQLKQTGVIGFSKDDSKWDWRLVHDLVSGPLCDPAQLHEALSTKFFKRLLRFFSPRRENGFGNFECKPENLPFAKLGLLILGLLLVHPAARQQFLAQPDSYFHSSSFPNSLADMFKEELNECQSGTVDCSHSVLQAITSGSSRRAWRGKRNSVDVSELSRMRSNSDPPDRIGRSRSAAQSRSPSRSPPLGARASRSVTPGVLETERSSSHGSVLGELGVDGSVTTGGQWPNSASEVPCTSPFVSEAPPTSHSSGFMGTLNLPWAPSFRPLASSERSRHFLAREYSTFFGLMSSSAEGVEILKNTKVYETLQALCEIPSKDYLVGLLLPQLHFGFEANRQLLEKVVRSGSMGLQFHAVQLLTLTLDNFMSTGVPNNQAGFMLDAGAGVVLSKGKGTYSHLLGSRRAFPRPASQISLASMCSQVSSRSAIAMSAQDRSRCNSMNDGGSVFLTDAAPFPDDGIESSPGTPRTPRRAGGTETASEHGTVAVNPTSNPHTAVFTFAGAPEAVPESATFSSAEDANGKGVCAEVLSTGSLPEAPAQAAPIESAEPVGVARGPPEDVERWPWIIEQLAMAAMHGEQRVARAAVETLQEVCCNEEAATALLAYWPSDRSLQVRWPAGLRMLMLQSEKGFHLMHQTGWLNDDFDLWRREDHFNYVDVVSTLLGIALSPPSAPAEIGTQVEHKAYSAATRNHQRCRSRDFADTCDKRVEADRLPVPNLHRLKEDSSASKVWLCSVPWRPSLHIQHTSPSAVEELLDVIVERAVPHEVHRRLERRRRGQNRMNLLGVRNELRITALCNVALGTTAQVKLKACLAVGALNLEEATSTFESIRDWRHVCHVEDLLDNSGSLFELQHVPHGAIWTFLDDHGRHGNHTLHGQPSSSCRLTAISWPLRLPDREHEGLIPPPHFCAYIANTLPGADFLRQSNFVELMIRRKLEDVMVRQQCGPNLEEKAAGVYDPNGYLKVRCSWTMEARAALWAAGHLGRSPLGLELLLESGTMHIIVELASKASRSSLRCTAIYCLALIGSNPLAAEPLDDLGWDAALCGPQVDDDIPHGRALAPWLGEETLQKTMAEHVAQSDQIDEDYGQIGFSLRVEVQEEQVEENIAPHASFGTLHQQALDQLKALHNTVVRKKSYDTLRELRKRDSATFLSVQLWWCAQQCIAGPYYQPLPVRRFIADLFSDTLKSREALEYLDTLPV